MDFPRVEIQNLGTRPPDRRPSSIATIPPQSDNRANTVRRHQDAWGPTLSNRVHLLLEGIRNIRRRGVSVPRRTLECPTAHTRVSHGAHCYARARTLISVKCTRNVLRP